MSFAAFRCGLLSRRELLSHFMHADGLALVVPGPISWRPSATSRSERMPSSAPGEFLDALEQPTRLPSASPATKDHSLTLFIGFSPARNHGNDSLNPKCVSAIQVKTRLCGKP